MTYFRHWIDWFLFGFFFLLVIYSFFSFSLTAPNLVFTYWQPFVDFQFYMWRTFFNNRILLSQCYFSIITLLFLIYLVILKLLHQEQKPSIKKISLIKRLMMYLLIICPLLFSNNALSYDVFNYIFNARMVIVYQADPHIKTALDFIDDPWTKFMHNVHTPAPYWYGWTFFSLLPYVLGFNTFLLTYFIFRLLSVISLLLLFFSLKYLAQKLTLKINYFDYAWLFLNPLLIIEIISNAHNDLWMMMTAIFSLALLIKPKNQPAGQLKNIFLSIGLFTFSVSIKYATLVLLPIYLLLLINYLTLYIFSSKLFNKFYQNIEQKIPFISSFLLFLPLFTARSQQFHPWYLTWSLVWLPLIKNKLWRRLLILFSFSSLLRYLPWMYYGGYSDEILFKQQLISWLMPFILLIFLMIRDHFFNPIQE